MLPTGLSQESVPRRPSGRTHPLWAQTPWRPLAKQESQANQTKLPGRTEWTSGRRRGRGLRTSSAAGPAGRKDAAPPHTCGSLPRTPTRLGRRSSAALGRCDAAPCPRLRWARPPSSRIPSKQRHLCRVPGRLPRAAAALSRESAAGLTAAGSSSPARGLRRPEPRARCSREAGGSLEELSPRLAPSPSPSPPPRPPGLRARVTAERLLKGAAATRTGLALAAAPTPGRSGRGPEAARGAHLPRVGTWIPAGARSRELRPPRAAMEP